jgi:hypothetical protein
LPFSSPFKAELSGGDVPEYNDAFSIHGLLKKYAPRLTEAILPKPLQKKERTFRIPPAIPMIMKIPMKEPVIRSTVPSPLPFLRKKLTMLAERIPKPRMGRAESRIKPTFPRDITFLRIGLSSK